jgi:hypothetical protein
MQMAGKAHISQHQAVQGVNDPNPCQQVNEINNSTMGTSAKRDE